jgi:hypothetical protein
MSNTASLTTAPTQADAPREYIVIASGHGSRERPDYPPLLQTHAEAEAEADYWVGYADTIGGTASVVRAVNYIAELHAELETLRYQSRAQSAPTAPEDRPMPQTLSAPSVTAAIAAVEAAATAYGHACAREMELEDERALLKAAAVRRLMQTTNELTNKPHSASSAEAVVEIDREYATHRAQQRDCVVIKNMMYGQMKAAELRARRAVGLEAIEAA